MSLSLSYHLSPTPAAIDDCRYGFLRSSLTHLPVKHVSCSQRLFPFEMLLQLTLSHAWMVDYDEPYIMHFSPEVVHNIPKAVGV